MFDFPLSEKPLASLLAFLKSFLGFKVLFVRFEFPFSSELTLNTFWYSSWNCSGSYGMHCSVIKVLRSASLEVSLLIISNQ